MFSSIYTGLSGLLSFSKGLDIISNNVSNVNTPGFKSSQLYFEDLFYQSALGGRDGQGNPSSQIGGGVSATKTNLVFRQGQIQGTGNALDAAIDGNGFFVLRKDNKTYYTRSGQFEFDVDGYLVEKGSDARVAALLGGESLADISNYGYQTNAASPTSRVSFVNNLSTGGTRHEITNLTVYDSVGTAHVLKVIFTNNSATTAGSWSLEVRNSADAVVTTGEIRFSGNGSPQAGFNQHTFTFSPTGVSPSSITLYFGDAGSLSGATSFSGGTTSTLSVQTQDGYSVGSQTNAVFDEEGFLTISYSNGQTRKLDRLALAWFTNLQSLELSGGNLFASKSGERPQLGHAGTGAFGDIAPMKLELSNVELTEEFTDIVIVQRGYQASSQVISVSNEMIQQLFDLRSRKG
jgi:flagellar hook protein FlgE